MPYALCPMQIHMDIAISIKNLSKKYRLFNSPEERFKEALHPFKKKYHKEFWALKDVTFDVPKGSTVGIIGRNGSGKSTLLQIICGVLKPTNGTVTVNSRISALLELGAGFNPELTGRQNVILNGIVHGFSRDEMNEKITKIQEFADIGDFFDQPVKTYSSGMFVRVAFAAAIHVDPEILVVDEALSVGDSKFQHRCFQRIREFMERGKTILVVSHSTDTLLRICSRGIVFDSGKLSHIGSIASAVNHYQNLLFGSPDAVEKLSKPAASENEKNQTKVSTLLIGALSDDIRDKVPEKPSYNSHEVRIGNGAATIIDFDLISAGAINPHEIPAQAEIDLIIKIRFNDDLTNTSVGFAFVTIDGTYVFGTNMFMMQAPLINAEAGNCYAVRFKFMSRLAGGEYFLNIGCNQFVDGTDKFLDVRRSVARIKFSDTPGVVGFVDLGVVHEVIDLNITRICSI